MTNQEESEARERVLNVAERLFNEHGYAAITLKDISTALGMRQASLYYHVPGGKEALFVEVMERGLKRHRIGLEAAIDKANGLEAQLQAAARWMLSQPMPDIGRMTQSDMPSISEHHAQRLMQIAYQSLLMPLDKAFRAAYERGDITMPEATTLAGMFVSFIGGIHHLPEQFARQPKEALADKLIGVMLRGIMLR